MINYEYYDTWWLWDTFTIVSFILISCYAYYYIKGIKSGRITLEDDEDYKIENDKFTQWFIKKVNPFWFCLALALSSFLFLGLYCYVVVISYLLTIIYWNYQWKKEKKQG